MAAAIAAEWDAQTGEIDPRSMPVTRAANSALDKVIAQRAEVIDLIAEYAGTDLLCYRATSPEALQMLQANAWDPLLDWADATFGARLRVTQGIAPIEQDPEALDRLKAEVAAMTAFELVALYDLVGITSSLVLGLAVTRGHSEAEAVWAVSRIDDHWQISQWGEDEEAANEASHRHAALIEAAAFWKLARAET